MLVTSLATTGRRWLIVLLRLAYLGVTNALAILRLLPMGDRAKDAEIRALRTQLEGAMQKIVSMCRSVAPAQPDAKLARPGPGEKTRSTA